MADRIFHITTAAEWRQALDTGRYVAPSLADEGFLHASTAEQVPATAERYYAEVADLVLLVIDPDAVDVEIRWEESRPGEHFPHLYGSLATAAVLRVLPFGPQEGGGFVLPPGAADA